MAIFSADFCAVLKMNFPSVHSCLQPFLLSVDYIFNLWCKHWKKFNWKISWSCHARCTCQPFEEDFDVKLQTLAKPNECDKIDSTVNLFNSLTFDQLRTQMNEWMGGETISSNFIFLTVFTLQQQRMSVHKL